MSKTLMNLVSTSFRHGKTGRGVLTTEQALVRAHVTKTLITVSSRENGVFFFTDDHCFGYPYLANEFVSCTMAFPMHVTPRASLPTGVRFDISDVKSFMLNRLNKFGEGSTSLSMLKYPDEIVNLIQ